jgi:hypothetical protein
MITAMPRSDNPVRPLTLADLDWVVDLAARRAREREPFAPRFWRRAAGARATHAAFLGDLIQDPGTPSLRTDNGFAFGLPRPGGLLVDDIAVDDETRWPADGTRLIRSLAGPSPVRLVCPVPDRERTAVAVALGLRVAESWWHRDLEVSDGLAGPVDLLDARLVTAPPVYDPGGPVLLVTEFRDAVALQVLEKRAARAGARVAVVSQRPADVGCADLLVAAGYRRTCDFRAGTLAWMPAEEESS